MLRGTVIDSPERTELRVREQAVLGIEASGRVAFCEDAHEEELHAGGTLLLRDGGIVGLGNSCTIRKLPARGFVCPGFVDTHTRTPPGSSPAPAFSLP